jgi:hypothetical protein
MYLIKYPPPQEGGNIRSKHLGGRDEKEKSMKEKGTKRKFKRKTESKGVLSSKVLNKEEWKYGFWNKMSVDPCAAVLPLRG